MGTMLPEMWRSYKKGAENLWSRRKKRKEAKHESERERDVESCVLALIKTYQLRCKKKKKTLVVFV
jgi:hypothetical protein